MRLSDEGIAFLASKEGKRNRLYEDSKGHCTIGIGHLVHEGRCDGSEPEAFRRGLTDAEVYDLFRRDVERYEAAVNRVVRVTLNQRQFDRLVSFAFNWGIGEVSGFPSTSVLRLVNAGDWGGVARELVDGRGPPTREDPQGRRYDKNDPGVRARRREEAVPFAEEAKRQGRPKSTVEIIRAAMADLEADGVPVAWVPGWESRGRPYPFNPRGAIDHHTGTKAYEYDYPSLRIVRDGRSDLVGPLAHFGIGRHSGTVYVIASGYCNHAGPGGWNGLRGNESVWCASEAENDGEGEKISPAQMKARLSLHVSLARHTGYGANMICCHREWSTKGKPDPKGIDGKWLRAQIAARLMEVPDMAIVFDGPKERGGGVWITDGVFRKRIRTGDTWGAVERCGAKHLGVAPIGFFDDLIDVEAALERLTPDATSATKLGLNPGEMGLLSDAVASKVADILQNRIAS